MRSERGFSIIEAALTISVFGLVTALAVAPIRDSLEREAVRGARLMAATHVARARGAASSRGCAAVMHLDGNRVWVTTCGPNQVGGVDTVGVVDDFMARYHVELGSNRDSVVFAPTGIMASTTSLRIQLTRSDLQDSLGVSPTGRVMW